MIPGQSTATEISDFGADDTNNIEAGTATTIANTRKASFLTDAVLSYAFRRMPGISPNVFSYKLNAGTKAQNYNIFVKFGELEIKG